MDYSKQDLVEYIGKRKALAHFTKLRKANIGYPKMSYCKSKNSHTKEPIQARVSMIFFNPDEVITQFENLKQEYIDNPLKHARPLYLKSWDNAIEVAKYFKGKQ